MDYDFSASKDHPGRGRSRPDSGPETFDRVAVVGSQKVLAETQGGIPGIQPFNRFHFVNESSIDFA
jgi:hypothetical protein